MRWYFITIGWLEMMNCLKAMVGNSIPSLGFGSEDLELSAKF